MNFQNASIYYHDDANYNFSHLIDWAEIQVGGSYRKYKLNSSGTIYTDFDGPIEYSEYGIYTQIQKNIELNEVFDLKLTGSIRYDKSAVRALQCGEGWWNGMVIGETFLRLRLK